MILGISASGRRPQRNKSGTLLCGSTEEIIQHLLEKTGEQYELVSLSGKHISGCMGCVLCAGDNICVLEDDWAEIRDKMFKAEAVVFGAPDYYGVINALGHAFLERTFSLRHRETFPLSGKLNVIVTSGSPDINPVEEYIRKIEQLQKDALLLLSKYDDSIDPECSDEFLSEDLWLILKDVAFATGCQIWFMTRKQSSIFVSGRIANLAKDEEVCFIEDIALSSNGLQKILNYFNGRNLIVNIEPISQKSYKLLVDFRNVDSTEQEKIQQELVEKLPTKFFRVSERSISYGYFTGGVT